MTSVIGERITEADRALKPHSVILSMEKVLISAI